MSVGDVVYELGHDREFMADMGHDYANPNMRRLVWEINGIYHTME